MLQLTRTPRNCYEVTMSRSICQNCLTLLNLLLRNGFTWKCERDSNVSTLVLLWLEITSSTYTELGGGGGGGDGYWRLNKHLTCFAILKFSLLKNSAACPYMLSVSLIRCKNEALKNLHLKSTIKCFKEVKIDKWPDLSYQFLPKTAVLE